MIVQLIKNPMMNRLVLVLKAKKQGCEGIERKIPKSQMQEGIDLCIKNIADYLLDARIIAKDGRLHHALISAEFAIEELGKMLLLKESLAKGNDPVEIDVKKFCSHPKKANKAWDEVLDRKYQVLFVATWDDEGVWDDSEIWYETTEISNTTRLDCAFVDYVNNRWTCEKPIDPNLFNAFLTYFETKLKKFQHN